MPVSELAQRLKDKANSYFKKDKFLDAIDAYIQVSLFLSLSLSLHFCWLYWKKEKRREIDMPVSVLAQRLKDKGNSYFKKNKFLDAIDAYTQAIELCPSVPVYWTNRALCHRKRNDWKRVDKDCRRALELDHNSVKAHYMLGLVLVHKREYSAAVKELEKALDLAKSSEPDSHKAEEIWPELAKARYLAWEYESGKRGWELQILKETCEEALKEKHAIEASVVEGSVDVAALTKQLRSLECIFKKVAEDDTPTEVPGYLCCQISLDIFHDPVITPSGITYDRSFILEHLKKVGNFDPVTREPLTQSQLVPNLAIKEAARAYLEEHAWAYRLD